MAVKFRLLALALTVLLVLPGCTNPQNMDDKVMDKELELPEHLNLVADTEGEMLIEVNEWISCLMPMVLTPLFYGFPPDVLDVMIGLK